VPSDVGGLVGIVQDAVGDVDARVEPAVEQGARICRATCIARDVGAGPP
jgi:hypothetical protein